MPLLVCGAASEVHLGVSVITTPYAKWGRAGRTTAAPHLCMSRVPAIEMDGSQKEFNKDLLPGMGWDPKGAQRILGSGNFQGLCFSSSCCGARSVCWIGAGVHMGFDHTA